MAHKRKPTDPEPPREDQIRQMKHEYYERRAALEAQLKHEYDTELTHMKTIMQDKRILGIIRGILEELHKPSPTGYVTRHYEGGWGVPIRIEIAQDILVKEQRQFEDRIQINMIQMKKAVEKQKELRKRISEVKDFQYD